MGWGAKDKERVRVFAEQGFSARQIASEFPGVTRNAVIGRMKRAGIPFLNSRGGRADTVADLPEPISIAEPEPMPKPEPIAEPSVEPVSTRDVGRGQCRWPMNDGVPHWTHCGAYAPHGPYCEPHKARAFSHTSKRDAA